MRTSLIFVTTIRRLVGAALPACRGVTTLVVLAVLSVLAAPAAAQLQVVASHPTVGALAQDVGGAAVRVRTLARADEDPHYVDARPDFVVALNRADVLVHVGMELEVGWLPALVAGARNPRLLPGARGLVDCSAFITPLEVPVGRLDRAMGDVHPEGNPHYIYDARAMAQVAFGLGEALATADPANADGYRQRARTTAQALLEFSQSERARFAALPTTQRRIVTYHRSLPYLTDWLQLDAVIELEPRPGIPPDPGHVATVLQTMRAQSVRTLVQESWYPRNTADTLARLADAQVVTFAGGPNLGQDETYLAYVRGLTGAIYASLVR